MTEIGPQVAIVDDKIEDVSYLMEYLKSQGIGYRYFDADTTKNNSPKSPLTSVELVFLDLYYTDDIHGFNAAKCAQWIDEIIPDKKQYELVIWSKDSHKEFEVLEILSQINKSPRFCITKQKNDYPHQESMAKLIDEIKSDLSNYQVDEFIGEILHADEDSVIIDCLIDFNNKIYQKRRFEIAPFKDYISLEEGNIITIRVSTKPGSVLYEYLNNPDAGLKNFFDKGSFFEGIDENSFAD